MVKVGFVLGAEASTLPAASIRELEASGVDSLWGAGRLSSRVPAPEAVTTTARLAALTERATVGTAVLVLPLHPPLVIAKQFAELDHSTGGRIALGIGVGSDPAEAAACGVDPTTRGARADEAIEVIRALWEGGKVTRTSPWWDLARVSVSPPPLRPGGPPILVAGRKSPAMRRAARVGAGWLPTMFSPGAYERSVAEVREHAAAIGRDLGDDFEWLCLLYARVDADGERARLDGAAAMAAEMGGDPADYAGLAARSAAMGTPEEVAAALQRYVDAGVTHLILNACGPDAVEQRLRIMADVVPLLDPHRAAPVPAH